MSGFQVRKAERRKAKLKLGVSGPSGSGKTYSALMLASGIARWEKITVIDTENGSGELYSHLGPYNVIPFQPPFGPDRYVQALRAAVEGGAEVVVIDSISHEWDGKGGCLEMQTQLGGRYQDWGRVTPKHNAFVEALLQAPAHIIVTTRKKQDYEMSKDGEKNKVKKVGMKEIQREGFEYELTINFDVEMNHYATASKDRSGLFMPRGPFQINKETGEELLVWANSGAALPDDQEKTQEHTSPKPPLAQAQNTKPAEDNLPNQWPKGEVMDRVPHTISEPQGKRLWAIAKQSRWTEEELRDLLHMEFNVGSIKQVLKSDYQQICEYIEKNPNQTPIGVDGRAP